MKKGIIYTDPTDLFLNGVMDTRQGTCANMAILFVALCWRLGWPVRLACLRSHYLARYDDGTKTYNIETSQIGSGIGFRSPPDQWYIEDEDLPKRAVDCGSDLRALSPRETLGVFFGLRARHRENTHQLMEAEPDYLIARYLFPNSRQLYINQNQVSVQCSMKLFEPHEKGHPVELSRWLQDVVRIAPWRRNTSGTPTTISQQSQEKIHVQYLDRALQQTPGFREFL